MWAQSQGLKRWAPQTCEFVSKYHCPRRDYLWSSAQLSLSNCKSLAFVRGKDANKQLNLRSVNSLGAGASAFSCACTACSGGHGVGSCVALPNDSDTLDSKLVEVWVRWVRQPGGDLPGGVSTRILLLSTCRSSTLFSFELPLSVLLLFQDG